MSAVDVDGLGDGAVRGGGVDVRRQRPHQLDAVAAAREAAQRRDELRRRRVVRQVELLHRDAAPPPRLGLVEPAATRRRDRRARRRTAARVPLRQLAHRHQPEPRRRGERRRRRADALDQPRRERVAVDKERVGTPHRRIERRAAAAAAQPLARLGPAAVVDGAERARAPRAPHVVAAARHARRVEGRLVHPVVAPTGRPRRAVRMQLHQPTDRLRRGMWVAPRLLPPLEARRQEVAQQLAPRRVTQRLVRREEHLRVAEPCAAHALEREHVGRRAPKVVLHLHRLHHVVHLHRVHLARAQQRELLDAPDGHHLGRGHQPLEQTDRVLVHADARRLGRITGQRPRRVARQRGQRERRAAKHGRHRLHRRALPLRRDEDVLLGGADGERAGGAARHDRDLVGVFAGAADGQHLQLDATALVEAGSVRHGQPSELRRHEVVGLETHSAQHRHGC